MDKRYVSIDVEASGPTPGKYSMLSLGACIVGEIEQQFYIEFKPISQLYIVEAMRKGCLGLRCLEPFKGETVYDPQSEHFRPDFVLDILAKEGVVPDQAMARFHDWVLEETRGFKPIAMARPIVFDGGFANWYFDNFNNGKNPFGHSGEDVSSLYRGYKKDMGASITELLPPEGLSHNALEDAIEQARVADTILKQMKR